MQKDADRRENMPEGAERRRETRIDVDRRGNTPTDAESRVERRRDAEMQEKTPGDAQRRRKTRTDAEIGEKTHKDAERDGKTPTTALPVSLSRRFLKTGPFFDSFSRHFFDMIFGSFLRYFGAEKPPKMS